MEKHQWNNFQIGSFACWLVGAILIIAPAAMLYSAWSTGEGMADTGNHIWSLLIGVVLLATGGTLHKIGMSRERH